MKYTLFCGRTVLCEWCLIYYTVYLFSKKKYSVQFTVYMPFWIYTAIVLILGVKSLIVTSDGHFFCFHFLSEVAKVTKTSKSKCYRANESKFQSHIAISDHRLPLQHFSYWQTMYVSERYEEPNIARHSLILIVSQISLVFHVVTFLFCKR